MICGIFVEALKTTFRFNDLLTRLNKLRKVILLSGIVYYALSKTNKGTAHWGRAGLDQMCVSSPFLVKSLKPMTSFYSNIMTMCMVQWPLSSIFCCDKTCRQKPLEGKGFICLLVPDYSLSLQESTGGRKLKHLSHPQTRAERSIQIH